MENENLTKKDIQELLNQQTKTILDAVDEKLARTDVKIVQIEFKLTERMEQMELRISEKIEKLTTTLDGFLKRMTDMEDEFAAMKADLNRVKIILREKLGVAID